MLLRAGNYHKEAFGAAGISADTFYQWIKDDPDFSDCQSVTRAVGPQPAHGSLAVLQLRRKNSFGTQAVIHRCHQIGRANV